MTRILLAVFAHPDDETFRPGGTLAWLAQRDVRVHLLTATRGEAGSCGEPPLCAPDELPAVRARSRAANNAPNARGALGIGRCVAEVRAHAKKVCTSLRVRRNRRAATSSGNKSAATCPRKGLLLADRIEQQVMDAIGQINLPEVWKTRIAQLATATPERSRLDEQRRLINSQLERLQKLFMQGDLAEEEYDKRKARLHNELKQLAAQEPTPVLPAQMIAPTMRYFLEHATPEETKRIYRMLFRAVCVSEQIERYEFRKPFGDLLGNAPSNLAPSTSLS